MPVNIGPRIGIEGEDEYRKQITNLVQQTKTLEAQMKALAASTDKETSAQQKAAKQVEALTKKQDAQRQKVEVLKKMVAESAKATGENSTATLKWQEALANAEGELSKTNAELDKAKQAADGFGDEVEESSRQMETFSEAAVMMARQTIADTLNKAADAAGRFGKQALGGVINTTKDFDSAMSNVKALSGATGKEFDTLRKKAREMGASTKYSATESADALGYMALAGWDTNQMVEGLDGVLNLAAASGMELAEASDIVTDFLGAFGKEAKDAGKMADMMAYAQAHSNTTTIQLGEAFRNSAANMHTAGQSMETTTALLEAMANQGNKGSEAGTALAAMMRDLTQKMKDGKIMIGDTAVQVMDANGNFRNMIDILRDVDGATAGMGSAQKSAALMTTFTARSVKGVNQVLTEGVDKLAKYEQELMGASGAAGDMAAVMQDNLEGQLTRIKSGAQELAIAVGDELTPYLRAAADGVIKLIDGFNALPPGTKKAVAVLLSAGTATAVVIPKLIAMLNTIKSLQAARAVLKSVQTGMDGIQKSAVGAEASTKKLGNVISSFGKYAGIVGGVVGAFAAFNKAVTTAQLKNNELYQTSRKNVDALRDVGDAAYDMMSKIQAQERLAEIADRLGTSIEGLRDVMASSSPFMDKFAATFGDARIQEATTLNEELNVLFDILENGKDTIDTTTTEAEEFSSAAVGMGDDAIEAAGEVEDSFETIYKSAKDDLKKTTSIINAWADESGDSMDDVVKIMQDNAKAWTNWSANVETLTRDARYTSDANFRSMVDTLIQQEGKGAVALQQFADAVRTNNNTAVANWTAGAGAAKVAMDSYIGTMSYFKARTAQELTGAVAATQTGVSNLQVALNNGAPIVRQRAIEIATSINYAKPDPAGFKASAEKAAAELAAGLSNKKMLVKNNAVAIAQMQAYMKNNNAYTWGADAVAALAKGMNDKRWQVRKVANIIAQDVKDRLGHSTPKLGPLHGDDQWGYHMVENLIDGMKNSTAKLKTAAYEVADIMATPSVNVGTSEQVSNSLTYGDIVVNVSGANIQNEDLLAQRITQRLFTEVQAQRGAVR